MKTNTKVAPEQLATELLTRIIKEITFHHENIRVTSSQLGRSHTLAIQVHKGDMPRVLGKSGAHIKALETLAAAIGASGGVTIRLRLLEPEVGEPDRYEQFRPAENWNSSHVVLLLSDLVEAIFGSSKVEIFDGEDCTSALEVTIATRENKAVIDAIGNALKVLFKAIGRANGRILTLDIATDSPNTPRRLSDVLLTR